MNDSSKQSPPRPPTAEDAIARARECLRLASRIVVLTGAGISAESGIPTFRGAGGLWRNFRPEELATPQAFVRDPRLVWEWYDWRRGMCAAAAPNPAHVALVALEDRAAEFTLVTQNVDGLHRRAGSRNVIHLHGDIWMLRCTHCGAEREDRRVPLEPLPPRCRCGALERPGIVWFGEQLPEGAMERAAMAVAGAEVVLVVGTSSVVWPAAGLIPLARRHGAIVIEINPEETGISADVLSIRGRAGEVLPRIVEV